jgi:hypothetical protein
LILFLLAAIGRFVLMVDAPAAATLMIGLGLRRTTTLAAATW